MRYQSLLILLVILLTSYNPLHAQTPVVVAENNLKVGLMGEEIFYYGFAAGDKIIFDFEETKGKELKEVEIVEMPATSRYIDYKTKKIAGKVIEVSKTGIYKFRFTNSSIVVRICNFKIQRVPASATTQNFNTSVYTHVINDSTYTTEEETYLDNTDTVITNYQDRVATITPAGTANKTTLNFTFPENIVAWSYYLYTTDEGKNTFTEKNNELTANSKLINYNLMAAIAMNAAVSIKKLSEGPEIDYWIVEGENAELFLSGAQFRMMKKGKAINDYSRMEPRKGNLFFCFTNNTGQPINTTIKLTTIHINEAMKTRQVKRIITTPKSVMYLKN
ncbi:MAG: hypothetical protein ABIP79_16080 [Chitinophagaceae bacterium]